MPSRRVLVVFLFSVLLLAFASSAAAQSVYQKGVLFGLSGSPGQFFVGGHIHLKEITSKISFRPGADVGAGDGLFLASLNGEAVYYPKGTNRDWMPYAGAGPAFVVQAFRGGRGDSGVGPGFNFIGGIQERKGLFVEIKIGAFDSQRFKAGFGWTW
jgi:hypothetical protein